MRVAGIVLAGGEGRRLGGVVKPLLRVEGIPILTKTLDKMRPFASPLLVSTGAIAPERFDGFSCDGLVPDAEGPSAGPLAGLFAAVSYLRQQSDPPEWLLSTAGDCPDLPEIMPETLLSTTADDVDVVFASFAGQSYPPNAVWRFRVLNAHFDALGGAPQGRGPRQLISPERQQTVDFSDRFASNPFEGLNTLSDLVRLARKRPKRTAF
ncbi:MAG: NTP transferase domain-containing protein [Novosphingobium sp.]